MASCWNRAQASPASISSFVTVLIDTPAMRDVDRKLLPSHKADRIWTRGLPPVEQRANADASAMLFPSDTLKSFIQRVGPIYSKQRINQFANRVKIHPGIIVGQLQKRKEIAYSANREMLAKVRDFVIGTAVTDGWNTTIDPRTFKCLCQSQQNSVLETTEVSLKLRHYQPKHFVGRCHEPSGTPSGSARRTYRVGAASRAALVRLGSPDLQLLVGALLRRGFLRQQTVHQCAGLIRRRDGPLQLRSRTESSSFLKIGPCSMPALRRSWPVSNGGGLRSSIDQSVIRCSQYST